MTVEEYLELEANSRIRHDYLAGEIWSWAPLVLDSRESILELRSIGLAPPLAQIYEGEAV